VPVSIETPKRLEKRCQSLNAASTSACRDSAQKRSDSFQYAGASSRSRA
jgi:hypothetical protein